MKRRVFIGSLAGGLLTAPLAAELIRLKVDVIVAWGTTTALAATKATGTIPIVATAGSDPVGMGLAASLARPGGNVTGLTVSGRELVGKRIELLKEGEHPAARWGYAEDAPQDAAERVKGGLSCWYVCSSVWL